MCGITGFTGFAEEQVLQRMMGSLIHRGPDDAGHWQHGTVSLGMRRLSIVDVEQGLQPAENETGDVIVVFNGEIYNHLELRRHLERRGHHFRSDHSDTEIIPHLYEEFGTRLAEHLNGMFAIALWDAKRDELHLWRDRCGIKPLFYTRVAESLVFGSEIKAVLRHPKVSRNPDLAALSHYFSFKNIPAPFTAFSNISQLLPGEHLIFRRGEIELDRWWRPNLAQRKIDEVGAAQEIRKLLEDSVRLQMQSDVPFGAFLSGGLDSSIVVAMMARLAGQRIKTFTLVYEESRANKDADARFARQMARELQTEHYEYVMSAQQVPNAIPEIIAAFDEPFSGTISTYFLSELIARHVKVALSGDGADELFGSYLAHRLAQPLSAFAELRGKLGDDRERIRLEPFANRIDLLDSLYRRGDASARRMGLCVWDDLGKSELFSSAMIDACRGETSEAWARARFSLLTELDPLNRELAFDFGSLLPDQVLAFVDRLSMAHSVEVRPPFLDHRLVEYVFGLPGSLKIRSARTKHILKEAVKDLLPTELIDRPKEGFVMPVHEWILGELSNYAADLLSPTRILKHGLWRQRAVAALLARHQAGDMTQGLRVWNLMMFQVWWEKFFG